jgi:hypothetical protein
VNQSAKIEILGVDDSHAIINGPGVTDKLFLAPELKGIYRAPVTARYKSSAYQHGATYEGKKVEKRDLSFAVNVHGETPEDFQERFARWESMWAFEEDPWDPDAHLTKMTVTTPRSGGRSLWLALNEESEILSKQDPHLLKSLIVPMNVTAPQPYWFEDRYEDQYYDFFETGSTGTSTGYVSIANPSDTPIWIKWVITRGRWTLPDFSWTGKKYQRAPGGDWANRLITMPLLTDVNGGARIDLDRLKLPIRDFFNTNLVGQMNGIRFMHKLPPHTPEQLVPVKVEEAPVGGARLEVYCPHRWKAPWGGQ